MATIKKLETEINRIKERNKRVELDKAWETEVWVSDIPNHMIHFNGNKFLKLN